MKKRAFARRLLGIVAASAAGGCFIIIDPTEYDTGIGREGGGAPFGFDDLVDATDAQQRTPDASLDPDGAEAEDKDASDDAKDAEDEFG